MSSRGVLPRKRARRDASLVVIATEGARTEPAYFERLREHSLIRPKVIVEVVPPTDNASAPDAVLRSAKTAREGFGASQPDDRVWCVVDVDHHADPPHIATFTNTLKEAREADIDVAVSNPCFEIWYLLHFQEIGSAPLPHYAAVQALVGPLVPEPRLPGGIPHACIDRTRIDQAITRAATTESPDHPWPPQPGTSLHRLVASILAP